MFSGLPKGRMPVPYDRQGKLPIIAPMCDYYTIKITNTAGMFSESSFMYRLVNPLLFFMKEILFSTHPHFLHYKRSMRLSHNTTKSLPLFGKALCYFSDDFDKSAARYPNTTAAVIPPAVAVTPPIMAPSNPSVRTASRTPIARE